MEGFERGYWKQWNNVEYHLRKLQSKLGHFPSTFEMKKSNTPNLGIVIAKYHGGAAIARAKMGIEYKDGTNTENLKMFEEHRSELESLFAEIIARRKSADISLRDAYTDLAAPFGLGITGIYRDGCSSRNSIYPLEDIDSFERVIARPNAQGQAERYASRESMYLNYLGFGNELSRFFGIFSSIDERFMYHPNNIKPSKKITEWLKASGALKVQKRGYVLEVK